MRQPIKAKDTEIGQTYYSRAGTPGKILSKEKKDATTYEIVIDANHGTDKSKHTTVEGDYQLFVEPKDSEQETPEPEKPAKTAKPKAEKADAGAKKRKPQAKKHAQNRSTYQERGVAAAIKSYREAKAEFGGPPKLPKNKFLLGLLLEGAQTHEELAKALQKSYKDSPDTAKNRLNKFFLWNRPFMEIVGTKKNAEGATRTLYRLRKK